MADFVLKNQIVMIGGFDFSGIISEVSLEYGAEPQDNTALGDATRSFLPGLKMAALQVNGWWDGVNFDPELFARLGASPFAMSVLEGATEGLRSFSLKGIEAEYEFWGAVGEVAPYRVRAVNGEGVDGLARGQLIHNATKTSTGNGTAFQVGAVSATQRAVAAMHVLAVSGSTPTLDVIVQSDTSGFPSPTNRIIFAQANAIGAQFLDVAGPITDDFWRANYTIGGGSPSFLFAVTLGIVNGP